MIVVMVTSLIMPFLLDSGSETRTKGESFKMTSTLSDLLKLYFGVLNVAVERGRSTPFLCHHRLLVITTTARHSAIGIVTKMRTPIEDILRHNNDRHGDADHKTNIVSTTKTC